MAHYTHEETRLATAVAHASAAGVACVPDAGRIAFSSRSPWR